MGGTASGAGGLGGTSAGGSDGGMGGAGGSAGSMIGWSLATWSPDWCDVYEADDPSKALPPEKWLDCANGVAGCVYLDTENYAYFNNTPGERLGSNEVIVSPTGSVLLAFFYAYSTLDYAGALYEVAKGPRAAWRATVTQSCTFHGVRVSPNHFSVHLGSAENNVVRSRVAYGTLTSGKPAVGGTIDVSQPLVGQFQGVVEARLSSGLTALQIAIPGDIVVSTYPPATLEVLPRDPNKIGQHSQLVVNGSELIFNAQGNPSDSAIMGRQSDGTLVELYQNPTATFGLVEGDSERIVWQVLTPNGASGTKNELYTALWTTNPTAFTPVKVRDLPPGDFVRAGYAGGWFVYYHDDATLRAIRVSDGKYVDAPAPAGFGWVSPHGVFNGELYATIHIPPPGAGAEYSIARVPIAALGTPQG